MSSSVKRHELWCTVRSMRLSKCSININIFRLDLRLLSFIIILGFMLDACLLFNGWHISDESIAMSTFKNSTTLLSIVSV